MPKVKKPRAKRSKPPTKAEQKSLARSADFQPYLNKVFVEDYSQSAFQVIGWTGSRLIVKPVTQKNTPLYEWSSMPANTPVWERHDSGDDYLWVKDDMPVYYRKPCRLIKEGERFPDPNLDAIV